MKPALLLVGLLSATNTLMAQQSFERLNNFDNENTFSVSSILYKNETIFSIVMQTSQLTLFDGPPPTNHLLKFTSNGSISDSILIYNSFLPSDYPLLYQPSGLKLYNKLDSIVLYGREYSGVPCLSNMNFSVVTKRRCQINLNDEFQLGYSTNFLEDTECVRFQPVNFFYSNANSESYFLSIIDKLDTTIAVKYQIKDSLNNITFEKRGSYYNFDKMRKTVFFESNNIVKLYTSIPHGILVMDKFMNEIDTFLFPEITNYISNITFNQDYIAFETSITIDSISTNHIYVLNHSGNLIFDKILPKIRDIAFSGNYLLSYSQSQDSYPSLVSEVKPITVYKLDLSSGLVFSRNYGFPYITCNEIASATNGYFLLGGGIYYETSELPVPFQNKGYLLCSHNDSIDTPYYLGVPSLASKAEFSIYPNPFKEHFTVSFELNQNSMASVSLCDITGRELINTEKQNLSSGRHQIEIDSEELQKGVYFCKLSTDSFNKTRTIIKQ